MIAGDVGEGHDQKPGDVPPLESGLGPADDWEEDEERDAGYEPSEQCQVDRGELGDDLLDGYECEAPDDAQDE